MVTPSSRSMLSTVRPQDDTAFGTSLPRASRISFSPTVPGRHGDDETFHKSLLQTPRQNQVLQTFMKNQLDLQEADWEGYEATVNELAELLEKGDERIQQLEAEKEEMKQSTSHLESKLRQTEAVSNIQYVHACYKC